MMIRKIFGFSLTAIFVLVAAVIGRALWIQYMDQPWTRDGRVRADVVSVAPDVSGAVVSMPVGDNQYVKRGDLLLEIDPSHYLIAVQHAQASLAARRAELRARQSEAARRADMDSLVVSRESRENASQASTTAQAMVQQAQAELDAAKLNLARTQVLSPVDGYITNLNIHRGDYARAGAPRLAIVDSQSFWVYGYFEETKLPYIRIGDKARMTLMSGGVLTGHVEGVSRGIYDRDNPESRDLIADVNPTFNWVRLAQRVPVRIHIDSIPADVALSAGTTCTVVVMPSN